MLGIGTTILLSVFVKYYQVGQLNPTAVEGLQTLIFSHSNLKKIWKKNSLYARNFSLNL